MIWWLDMDAIITNIEVELARHIWNPHMLKERLTFDMPMNDLGDRYTGKRYSRRGEIDVSKIDIIFSQYGL
jgi:hypothetical protein